MANSLILMFFIVIDNIGISATISPTLEMQQGKDVICFGKLKFVGERRKVEPFDITHYATEYKNLYLQIRNEKLYVSNSLHKLYKGNNYSDFSYSEIVESIDIIEEITGIKPTKFTVSRLEFGLNISVKLNVYTLLDCIKTYKKRYGFMSTIEGNKTHAKSCTVNEATLKVYNKTFQVKNVDKVTIPENILRIEIVYQKNRVIPNIQTLEDLRNPQRLIGLVERMKKIIGCITIEGEKDFSNVKKEDRALYFAGLNSDFWKVEKTMNKDKGKSKKKTFDRLCSEVTQVSYKEEIMHSIDEKFNQLLGS